MITCTKRGAAALTSSLFTNLMAIIKKKKKKKKGGLTCGRTLLDHLILVVGDVSRQAAGQEDPDELRRRRQKQTHNQDPNTTDSSESSCPRGVFLGQKSRALRGKNTARASRLYDNNIQTTAAVTAL